MSTLLLRGAERMERVPWPWLQRRGLKVRWFDRWDSALGLALAELPDSSECSREMFAALLTNPSAARKCAAAVFQNDRPVAVIGLRKTGPLKWDTIGGGGVAPRFLGHSMAGWFFPALASLGLNVHISTQPEQAPARWVRSVEPHQVYSLSIDGDYESYWRDSGHHKTVRQARIRTRGFSVEIDAPGAAEWTIRGWADHWRSGRTVSWEDLVVAADHYGRAGRFHTVRLMDGREPIAGNTFLVENKGLLAVTTFMKQEYRDLKVGTRALDAAFQWAASEGFKRVDLGVGHEYKARWAPPSGLRWSCDVRPWHMHASARLMRRGRAIFSSAAAVAHHAFGAAPRASSADGASA